MRPAPDRAGFGDCQLDERIERAVDLCEGGAAAVCVIDLLSRSVPRGRVRPGRTARSSPLGVIGHAMRAAATVVIASASVAAAPRDPCINGVSWTGTLENRYAG